MVHLRNANVSKERRKMGFDLYGVKPKNEKGKYFRNNVWYFRPLWAFIVAKCDDILKVKQAEAGQFNDGVLITANQVRKIAQRLNELVMLGDVKKYEEDRNASLKVLPYEICEFCHGSGKRNDEYVKGKCNACVGKGKVHSRSCDYDFTEENVIEFIEFAENSGGFRIY